MKVNVRWLILMAVFSLLPLSACAPAAPVDEEERPVQLEPIAGTDLNRITLTEKAAERLGVETVTVQTQQVDGVDRLVIPLAALLYDPNGGTWVYINVEPLVFERRAITVENISGDQVILSDGPESGAQIVTMGATELFGSESEFEEE